jgi:motility quorum-sensing regulator/GCU-specific mRNA interferase toxin
MVTDDEQRRDYPRYALEEVRRLADREKVHFATSKVDCSVQDLDYTLEEVCRCLSSLTLDHFKESILYPGEKKWLDVYLIDYRGPSREIDKLYIKLRIGPNALNVHLFSFHLEGRFF